MSPWWCYLVTMSRHNCLNSFSISSCPCLLISITPPKALNGISVCLHFPWSPKSLTARWDTLWVASIRVTHPILCHSTRTVMKRLGPHLAFAHGMLYAYVTLLGSLFCLPSVLQDWAQLLLDWERVSFEPDYLQFGSFTNMTHIFGWLIYPSGNPSPWSSSPFWVSMLNKESGAE